MFFRRILTAAVVLAMAGVAAGSPGSADASHATRDLTSGNTERITIEPLYLRAQAFTTFRPPREVQRMISVQANIVIPPTVDVIGIMWSMEVREMIDGQGRDLVKEIPPDRRVRLERRYVDAEIGPHWGRGMMRPIMTGALTSLPRIPTVLKRLRCVAHVRVADKRITREVAPLAPGAMIDLTGGLSFQIVKVVRNGKRVTVNFRFLADQSNPFFNPNLQTPLVSAIDMVDDKGAVLRRASWSVDRQTAKDGLTEGEGKIGFDLGSARHPASLRVNVVTKAEDRDVEFTMENVTVPLGPGAEGR